MPGVGGHIWLLMGKKCSYLFSSFFFVPMFFIWLEVLGWGGEGRKGNAVAISGVQEKTLIIVLGQ